MFKTYMRLLGFARPIKKYAIPYGIYSLLYALFNSLTFMLIIPILNTMFDDGFSPEYVEKLPPVELNQEYLTTLFNYTYSHLFDTYDRQNVLLLLAAVAIIISFLSNLFRYLGSWTIENMRTRTLQKMRNEMFSRVMDMNVGYFSDQRKGDIISKITSDVGVVQFCITNTLQVSFREPFLIVGYIVMMIAISWELAIFSVLFLPLVALLIGNIVKRLRHPARTNQKRMGEMVSTLDESLSGIKVIKSYNATEYIKQKYYDISADLARLTLSMARRQQLASPMSEFLGITAVGVILVFGGALVSRGALDPGGFIAFVAIFSQITRPVRTFIDQFANINQGIAAGERIFSIIDTKPEIEDKPDARELKGLRDKIEFRHVHFSYDGTREVIDDISFEIRRGQTVALVGPSGGGKSTLSELRPDLGRDPHRRHLAARLHTGQRTRPHERRGAGYGALQRHDRGQHRHGKTLGHARGDRRGGQGGQCRQFHPRMPGGLRHQHRRPPRETLRRTAAAPLDCPRRAEKPRHPDPRRGHLGPRHRKRETRAGRPEQPAQGPHLGGHRPPSLDDPQCRQDHCRGPRPHRRAGHARRTDGPQRHLRQVDRNAVVRLIPPRPQRRGTHRSHPATSRHRAEDSRDCCIISKTFYYLCELSENQ